MSTVLPLIRACASIIESSLQQIDLLRRSLFTIASHITYTSCVAGSIPCGEGRCSPIGSPTDSGRARCSTSGQPRGVRKCPGAVPHQAGTLPGGHRPLLIWYCCHTSQRIRVSAQLFVYVTNLRCLFTFERDGTSSRQWGVSCKEMHSPLQCAEECPMYTCTQHETHSPSDIELEFAIN